MKVEFVNGVEFRNDGETIFVNDKTGFCVGTFSSRLAEVKIRAPESLHAETVLFIPMPVLADGTVVFLEALRKHHGIEVPVAFLGS
jgi:hypothetical protein